MTLKVITRFDDGFITRNSVWFFFVRICFKLFDQYIYIQTGRKISSITKQDSFLPQVSHFLQRVEIQTLSRVPSNAIHAGSSLLGDEAKPEENIVTI